ncbi:MAG TPA: ATP-binding protein [Azospirillum sp.]
MNTKHPASADDELRARLADLEAENAALREALGLRARDDTLAASRADLLTISALNEDLRHANAELEASRAVLRASEERFRAVVEHAPQMMWVNHTDGRLEFFNDSWRAYTAHDTTDDARWDVIHPDDRSRIQELRARAISAGEPYVYDMRVRRADGMYRWHVSRVNPMRQGGRIVAWIGTASDVHDLREAREAAERADRSKSRFLAAASHDLRQPMQSMFLFAEAMRARVAHDERARDTLVMLERGLETLKGLLDSLLDVTQMDAGVLTAKAEPFALLPLLREIGAAYAPIAASKGLDFQLEAACEVHVRSDRMLLGRIVRNLVENAVRYTETGHVALRCRCADGEALRIEVWDTGVGVPADETERIFEEFHQLGNPERDRTHGLGLGLAIVQRLSRLLGHPVEVRSEPGRGSVFAVSVPLAEAPAAAVPEPVAETAGIGRGRLAVLVDDDAIVLLGLRAAFEEWGYETLVAGSTDQAIARLEATGRTPDFVVADYRLRDGRVGTEAILKIREMTGVVVPGIILTGETGSECRRDAAAHGLGIAFKPITPRQLHDAVHRHLGTDPP